MKFAVSTVVLFLLSSLFLIGQQLQFVAENQLSLPASAEVNLPTNEYRVVDVPLTDLYQQLERVPQEATQSLRNSTSTIELPLPSGELRRFAIVESSVMQPAMQARWPQLRTYRLLDVEDRHYNGRLTMTPQGITAFYRSAEGAVFLEPYATEQARYHAVYYNRDLVMSANDVEPFVCGYNPAEIDETEAPKDEPKDFEEEEKSGGPAFMRIFTLALTCTGEYAQQKGGTVEAVLSSFVTAINIANVTFENEVGVRIVLLDNLEQVIYLNPGTDPFINSDEGRELLNQVGPALAAGGIPSTVYDMGHVFTSGCSDVGGVVGGQLCTPGKDRGVTCHSSNNITGIIQRIFTHEVAHQFGVGHTFSNCPGNLDQLATASAYEPGSGSTIMSYSGACPGQNIGSDDLYYHGYSIEEFAFFSRQGQGNLCAAEISTDNTEPEVTLNYTDGFYIPISTPFELNASGEDAEDDNLTFCWEQLDLGPVSDLGAPIGNAPLFRTFSPRIETNRIFPRLPVLVANGSENTEVLPTYSRDLTFRCTVRDNNPEIGATVWEDVAFKSTSSAGPFLVMSPNVGNETWKVGELQEVTWDVANTNNELVDCQLVNIRLSADGGFTYPYTLAAGTPNIGSALVTVPEVVGNDMRIRVEAANNIFFDISNDDFQIQPAEEDGYTVNYGPIFQQICLPDMAEVEFNTGAILGYDGAINLRVANELPETVTADFSANDVAPGETVNLMVDFTQLENYHGPVEIEVEVSAPGEETTYRTVYLDIVDNDFEELTLLTPVAGQNGVTLQTDFSWTAVPNADFYDWELSNDADFEEVLDSSYGLTNPEVFPSIQFATNELFFWRVRGVNDCGPGEWQLPRVFHTVNTICSPQASEDTPITIPGTGPLPTIDSEIFVPFSGVISDINIPIMQVRYQPVQNFRVSLVSPDELAVVLYDSDCFSTDQVTVGFDDEATNDIICPPTSGFLFRPAEPLSTFIGESSQGIWTLRVEVLETGFGAPGQIGNWSIEFCAEGNAAAPSLLTNDTLFVPPLQSNPVSEALLHVSDDEEGPFELTYSLVSVPEHGTLYRIDEELTVGSNFTQGTINAGNLRYVNTNGDVTNDAFNFVVEDGTGGFLPVQQFNIKVDDGAVVNTEEIVAGQEFKLFPNPTGSWATVQLAEPAQTRLPLRLYNVSGQLLWEAQLAPGVLQQQLPTEDLPAGIYVVQVGGSTSRLVKH